MALKCPFMSGFTFDDTGIKVSNIYIDCITADCRTWDTVKGECSIKIAGVHTAHIHDSHKHIHQHNCSEIPSACGVPLIPSEQPAATKLITEFMGNEDLDGNGLIYGYDFKITDGNDKPALLDGIESNPKFTATVEMTWADYLATL